jgi:glycine cleavage system H protein
MHPQELRYSKEHEWITLEGEVRTIGITHHAQEELGDIVFVELPKVGDRFEASKVFGTVESVKAVSELFSPVSGEIVEVNQDLADSPERINEEPFGTGWMIKVRLSNPAEIDSLLSAEDYEKFIAESKA